MLRRREAAAQAQRWVPGTGQAAVEPLASGLVNESYRVTRDGRVFSLRLAAAQGEDLGLDRRWECAVRERAGEAGLAPPLRCCEPEAGILVADWVTGRTWTAAQARQAGSIDVMAELLRRVHALEIPQPARHMDPGGWIGHYRAALTRRTAPTRRMAPSRRAAGRALSSELRRASDAYLSRLSEHPPCVAVLCHSDLHRLNLLIGERAVLLDWEYAHVSDGFWDLAGWVANNDWTQVEAGHLLAAYLRRPVLSADLQRLETWVWLYDYVCLMWCELYGNRRRGVQGGEVAARAELLATRLLSGGGAR